MFEGAVGVLKRKHIQAEALEVSRSTFQGIKKRIMETWDVNLGTSAVGKLINN